MDDDRASGAGPDGYRQEYQIIPVAIYCRWAAGSGVPVSVHERTRMGVRVLKSVNKGKQGKNSCLTGAIQGMDAP